MASSVHQNTSSTKLYSLPSSSLSDNLDRVAADAEIPVVDFSLLTGGSPDQKSQAVENLRRACKEWGFFVLVNHGVPEPLRTATMDAFKGFFNLSGEEKENYADTDVTNPIRYGSGFSKKDDVKFSRDYLKIVTHPKFYSPTVPTEFREVLHEYAKCTRELAIKLLEGIWKSLGIDEKYMMEPLNLNSCYQQITGNFYRPCPKQEPAVGLPPHSDHGLLTILFQNDIDGLEVKHNEKWVCIKPLPNSYLINIGDHMEIVSNGKYKSVLHRALVNGKNTRMSIVVSVCSSWDTVVIPAEQLVSSVNPAAFRGIKYGDFVKYQQSNRLREKSALDRLRI